MDDALFAKALPDGKLQLIVALPIQPRGLLKAASWTKPRKSRIHQLSAWLQHPYAASRAFDDLCSLRANEVRPVLACRMTSPLMAPLKIISNSLPPPSNQSEAGV